MPALVQTTTQISAVTDEPNVMKIISDMDANSGDAFDGSATPLIYLSENRMPVMVEFTTALIYIVFAALLLSLILILPGVRRTRFVSLIGILTFLIMGASIILGLSGSQWLTGSVQLYESPYSSLSSHTITGKLEINIGLISTNISLTGRLLAQEDEDDRESFETISYNERFSLDKPDQIVAEHFEVLRRGLPYPILTVTEFLSQDTDGFDWTRQMRLAGRYCSIALYAALASWFLTAMVMCVIPSYLPHMMQITAALIMSSVSIYTLLVQGTGSSGLIVGGADLELAFGYTYVATFVVGAFGILVGVLMLVIQINSPREQFTIMDSESYLNNQKALYKYNSAAHSANACKEKSHRLSPQRTDVIIPIDDFEVEFRKSQSNTTSETQSKPQ